MGLKDRPRRRAFDGAASAGGRHRRAEVGLALFPTPLGAAAVAWNGHGLVGLQLPDTSPGRTRARLADRLPDAREGPPPATVVAAIGAVGAVLAGTPADLRAVLLDWSGVSGFQRSVYEAVRGIAFGETASYGEVAEWLGKPGAARAVGAALGRNPFAVIVPCHRVVAAEGLGGFSATGGTATKQRMLDIERPALA